MQNLKFDCKGSAVAFVILKGEGFNLLEVHYEAIQREKKVPTKGVMLQLS